jgi:DNA-binding Xre family transcriptional regulator
MTSSSKGRKTKTAFGYQLYRHLDSRGITASALADAVGVTGATVSHFNTGERKPNADWVDLICNTLELSTWDRAVLHQAAARDCGFKIDLPLPPKRKS